MDRVKQDIQGTRNHAGWRLVSGARLAFAATALFIAGPLAAPVVAQLPCSYTVTVLPNAPCFNFQSPANPVAINNLGHVLLYGLNCGEPGYNETYIWTGGPTLTLIPRPAGMLGFAGADLNDSGVIVGQAQYASPVGPRAVIYDTNTGQWTVLPPLNPPSGWSGATAINNNNEVSGFRSIGSKDPLIPQQAFRWSASAGFTDLGVMNGPNSWATDIAEDGTVVGWTGGNPISTFTRAFVHTGGVTTILPAIPDGFNSYAVSALSSTRVAVEGRTIVNGNLQIRGYAYYDSAFIPLGVLPGFTRTLPVAVDRVGQVFGYCTAGNADAAFAWRDNALMNLNSLIMTPGATLGRTRDVNGNGAVVGTGDVKGDSKALVLTPVFSDSGDTNCDSTVNVLDLLNVINHWGACHGCSSDLNGDEVVGIPDLLEVLFNWD